MSAFGLEQVRWVVPFVLGCDFAALQMPLTVTVDLGDKGRRIFTVAAGCTAREVKQTVLRACSIRRTSSAAKLRIGRS